MTSPAKRPKLVIIPGTTAAFGSSAVEKVTRLLRYDHRLKRKYSVKTVRRHMDGDDVVGVNLYISPQGNNVNNCICVTPVDYEVCVEVTDQLGCLDDGDFRIEYSKDTKSLKLNVFRCKNLQSYGSDDGDDRKTNMYLEELILECYDAVNARKQYVFYRLGKSWVRFLNALPSGVDVDERGILYFDAPRAINCLIAYDGGRGTTTDDMGL